MKTSFKKPSVLCKNISSLLVLGALGAWSSGPTAWATSDVWDGSTSGVWSVNTNWLTDPAVVPGTGDTATFSGAGGGFTTIDLGAGVTIGTLLFDTAGAAAYTIGAGAVNSQTLTLNNAGAITMTATVAANEIINAALVLGTDGAVQTTTLANSSTTNSLTLAGSITGSTGAGLKTLAVSGAGAVNLSGLIANGTTGTVALRTTGAGTLTVSNANNTYSGGTTIGATAGAGVIRAAATQALGTGTITFDGTGNASTARLELIGGSSLNNAISLAGRNSASVSIQNISGSNTLGGLITLNAGGGNYWIQSDAGLLTLSAATAITVGAGARTVTVQGAGDVLVSGIIQNGLGTLGISKINAGSLTLSGANTYTLGTVLSAGTLNINGTSAIGTGALTINGGMIDNTSGSAKTLTTNNTQNWNTDFTFTGGSSLNMGTGAATLGGAGLSRTITVGANTLTAGSVTGVGYGLTKASPGTLVFGSAVSRITGILNVTGGTLTLGQNDFVAGGLAGSGTINLGAGTSRWLFIQNTGDNLFTGTLQDGGAPLGLNKAGTGTLTLFGPTTYTGQTTLAGGTIEYGTTGLTGSSRTVGNLIFDQGNSAVRSSSDGTGTASLTFLTSEARTAGATGNFIVAGGVNGTSNMINITKAAGYIDQGTFFNGGSYAFVNALNTYVRGIAYGSDAGAVTSGTTASLASATHQEFTGDITAQTTATFTTLKNTGNNAFTLAGGATVTTSGILKSGNVAGGATISGGTGIQAPSGGELVIRVDGVNDALTINTPILVSGASTLTTSGAGLLTLGGANTFTGAAAINSNVALTGSLLLNAINIRGGGTLTIPAGGVINNANGNNGLITVGASAGGNAILNITGGTVRAGKTTNPSLTIGNAGNSSGFVNISSGTLTTVNELHIGQGTGLAGTNSYAAFTQSGGTVTSGSWLVVGLNNDRAVLNQSGGTLTVNAGTRMTIGAGGAASVGVANFSGNAIYNGTSGVFVGEVGTGTLNVSGNAVLNLGTGGTLQFAGGAGANTANINLLGGVVSTNAVTKGTGTGAYFFSFNGGTLKATAANAAFFAALANTNTYVNSGGGTLDNGGFGITVSQVLRASAGNGVNGVASFTGGAGYIDTPVVVINRGIGDTTGVGATAVANVSGGVVTGITITNPGTGYTVAPTFTLFGGGYTSPATVTAAAPTLNSSGGMTFSGTGTTTLSGANTYTGPTIVSAGTLSLTGSLPTASAVTVNSTATLTGTPTASLGNVTIASGGTLAPGTAGVATITMTGLTLSSGSTLNYEFGVGNDIVTVSAAAGLQLNGGDFNLFATGTVNPYSTNGTYTVFNYNTSFAGSVNNFGITPATTVAGKTYVFTTTASAVQLTIGDATPIDWTGNVDGTWGSNANWTGTAPNAPATLARFGTALTGASAMTVSIGAGGKTVGGIIFDNAAPYSIIPGGGSLTFDNGVVASAIAVNNGAHTISAPVILTKAISITTANAGSGLTLSGNISGALPVIVSGSGTVTLGGANSHTTTTLNGGTLNINTTTAIGTGLFTIAGGTIDNASGSAKTLTTNNAQSWNGDFIFTGSSDLNLGTGAVAMSGSRTITTNGATTLTVGGAISGGGFGLTKVGNGTLSLGGASTYSGSTLVKAGTLAVTGGTLGALAADIQISPEVGNAGTLSVSSGVVSANRVIIGGNSANAGTPASGTLLQSGGVINSQQWFSVGSGVGAGNVALTGTYTMTGGTLNVIGQQMEVANFGQTTGVVTMSGASAITIQNSNFISLGANPGAGDGTFTQNGGTVTFYSDAGTTVGGNGVLFLGRNGAGTYTYDLNGGTLTVPQIQHTTGTGILNLNGGTLKAAKANTNWIQNLNSANVLTGGAVIDDGGFAVTIAQQLLTGDPADGGLTKLGAGTLTLSNPDNTYLGATRISNGTLAISLLPDAGVASSIGAGTTAASLVFDGGALRYTSTSTSTNRNFTINNGKTATFDVSTAGVELTLTGAPAAASTGGLSKAGNGVLILDSTAPNYTYTGATAVTGGTLIVNNIISGGASVSVAAGAALAGTGSIAGTFAHTAGTVSGGTIGGIGTVTFTGPLTLNGGTTRVDLDGSNTTNVDHLFANGGLNIAGSSPVNIEFLDLGSVPNTPFTFTLFNYTGAAVTGGQVANLVYSSNSGRSTFASDLATAGQVKVTVTPGAPLTIKWNSTTSGVWDIGATSNWKNNVTNAVEKFYQNDLVIFGDGGAFQTAITLGVSAIAQDVMVNSSTNAYTISGAGKITGLGTLNKSGSSTLTIQTNNDYTGTTTISAGTVNVGGGTGVGALGSGDITNNGTLIFSRTGATLTVANNISNGFTTGTGILTYSGGGTLTLPGTITQSALNITGTGSFVTLTGALTLDAGITVSALGTGFSSEAGTSSINGSGGITLSGAGNSGLGGVNGYDGAVIVNNGTLFPTSDSAFGNTIGATTVNVSGTIYATSTRNYGFEDINLNGNGTTNTLLRSGGNATSTFGGTISLLSGSSIFMDGGSGLRFTGANNGIAIQSATNSSLAVAGGGGSALSVGGDINLGTGILTNTSPAMNFIPTTTATVFSALAGSSPVNANSGTTIFTVDNTYTGATAINNGSLRIQTGGGLGTAGGITTVGGGASTGALQLAANVTLATEPVTLAGRTPGNANPHIESVSGSNILNSVLTLAVGGTDYNAQVDSGATLNVQSSFTTVGLPSGRNLNLQGDGTGTWSGAITDNVTAPLTVVKNGTGTWNLAGTQGYTTLTTNDGVTNVSSPFTGGTATVNANATTNFSVSQTLSALNIGSGAVVTLVASPPFAPFAGDGGGSLAGSAVVPEPGTVGLLLVGALGVLGRRRRSR